MMHHAPRLAASTARSASCRLGRDPDAGEAGLLSCVPFVMPSTGSASLQPERCDLYAGAASAEAPKFGRDRCAEEAQTILRIVSSQSSVEGFPAVLMRRRSGSHRLQSRSRSTRKEHTMNTEAQ